MVGPSNFLDILFTKSVPHILEIIFFSLDYESFKRCLEVSTAWRELLTSERYVKRAKSVFRGNSDENKLWQAAEDCNVEKVRGSIFVDVNCIKGWNKSTPLCVAAENASATSNVSQKNVIQLLLDRGANPNLANFYGWTPLHWAARNGKGDIIQVLLHREADPDLANRYGWTPLHLAAEYGHKDVVQLLLKGGAERNKADVQGETPLFNAARKGHKDVVQLLITAGAEPNKATKSGKTPLHLAQQHGHVDIIDILKGNAHIRDDKSDCEGGSRDQPRRSGRKRKVMDRF